MIHSDTYKIRVDDRKLMMTYDSRMMDVFWRLEKQSRIDRLNNFDPKRSGIK